jgi:hypothetical protein
MKFVLKKPGSTCKILRQMRCAKRLISPEMQKSSRPQSCRCERDSPHVIGRRIDVVYTQTFIARRMKAPDVVPDAAWRGGGPCDIAAWGRLSRSEAHGRKLTVGRARWVLAAARPPDADRCRAAPGEHRIRVRLRRHARGANRRRVGYQSPAAGYDRGFVNIR